MVFTMLFLLWKYHNIDHHSSYIMRISKRVNPYNDHEMFLGAETLILNLFQFISTILYDEKIIDCIEDQNARITNPHYRNCIGLTQNFLIVHQAGELLHLIY